MAEGNIGLAEPSTITKSLRSVSQTINSSVVHQEVMTIGSQGAVAGSSLGLAEVTASAPASTTWGLAVRIAGGPSSAVDLQARVNQGVGNSSVADYWGARVYQSTATDLLGRMNQGIGNSSAADRWLTGSMPNSTVWASSAGFHFDSSGALQVTTIGTLSTIVTVARQVGNSSAADYMPARIVDSSGTGFHGPTNPMPFAVTDSSNAVVKSGDSANNAIRVNVVAGAAGGSTVVTVARTIGNSSAADYMPVRLVDSSGTGFLPPGLEYTDGSTSSTLAAPGLSYINGSNTTMRMVGLTQPLPVQLVTVTPTLLSTRAVITSSNSTALYTLVSSAAGVGHKVYAYSLTSTETTPSTLVFYSSNSGDKWAVSFGSGSSGVTGANLAISPPAWLFRSAANEALRCLIEKGASTQCSVTLSFSYFTEA